MTSADTTKAMSKRQRRAQGSNPSTTWQQQPRIKSAASRAKAYINYAGLNDDDVDDDGKRTTTDKKNKGKTKKKVEEMLDPELDLNSAEVKFGRMLGGTEQRVRHKAVKMLRHYLKQRVDIATGAGLSELDLLKLWKAMWYTLYMADKVPVQDKLSEILAELMWCLAGTEEDDEYAGQVYMQITEGEDGFYEDEDEDVMWTEVVDDEDEDDEEDDDEEDDENAWKDMPSDDDDDDEEGGSDEAEEMDESEEGDEVDEEGERIAIMNESHCRGAHLVSLYVATFLRTVKREWGNVDKHRVDKFYTAVRLMIRESYKYMATRHWNLGIIRLFNDVIYEEALSHESEGLTNGLRFHLIDICIEELAHANANAEIPLTEATFLDCVEPFFALAQKAQDKNVHKRVMEKVLLKFLTEYSFVAPVPDEEEEEDAPLTFSQVHVGSVAKFIFEIASDVETDERFRKALYDMYKTYERQIRAAGKDVDLSHIEEDSEEDCCANNTCSNTGGNSACLKEEAVEEDSAEPEAPAETKSDKKKKKKKSKKKSKDMDEVETIQEEEKVAEVTAPKTKTSSKKKRKKDNTDEENITSEDITAQYDGSATKKSSKKKRDNDESTPQSKKKQRSSSPSVDPHSMPSPDQVISPPSSDADESPAGGSKRVSFGKMNHCKSYKASMKAIKTLNKERWDTKTRTPEKGILNKTPLTSKSSENVSSKKASSKKRKSKK